MSNQPTASDLYEMSQDMTASERRQLLSKLLSEIKTAEDFSTFSLKDGMSMEERGKLAAKVFADFINVIGGEKEFNEGFCEEFRTTHRTLQQDVLRSMFNTMNYVASIADKGSAWYDGRNEDGYKACQKVRDLFEGKPYLGRV